MAQDRKHIGTIDAPTDLLEAGAMINALVSAFDEAISDLAMAKGGYDSTWIQPLQARILMGVKGTTVTGTSYEDEAEATRKALHLVDLLFQRVRNRIPEA